MRRREFAALAAACLVARPAVALAQSKRMPVVGYMSPVVPENNTDPRFEALRRGLGELGYVEERNLRLEVRWGEGRLDRLGAIAAELVRLKVDVIVAATSPSVIAAKRATSTIPIVMPVISDPVGDGLVASLSRPGGNVTGLSVMAPELGKKRLELLREVLARQSRSLAVMWNPSYSGMAARFRDAQSAAPAIGLDVRSLEVRDLREMEAAFDAVARARPDGLVLLVDPLTLSLRARIIEFARVERLPAIYETREFVEAGGLMSYGPNINEQYRRAARYVDRILKGERPADMPIEQPAKIELLVNLKTARALGITIPGAVLAAADVVIE